MTGAAIPTTLDNALIAAAFVAGMVLAYQFGETEGIRKAPEIAAQRRMEADAWLKWAPECAPEDTTRHTSE